MKKLAWIIGIVGLLGSTGYLFSYIIRWQWNRALFSANAVVALLVVLGLAAVLRKLGQLEERLDGAADRRPDAVRPARDPSGTRPLRLAA